MHVIWTNQTTEMFVYHWQRTNASFDVTFPTFVSASDVISSVLSICYLKEDYKRKKILVIYKEFL